MGKWQQRLVILVGFLSVSYGDVSYEQEEEDMNYYLGKLYEDTTEDSYDLNDMLNYPAQKKQPKLKEPLKGNTVFGAGVESKSQDSCDFDKMKLEEELGKLGHCEERLGSMEREREIDMKKLRNLEKKLMSEGSVDMQAFYLRAVYHLWNVLELKDAQNILKENDKALIRRLTVRVTARDMDALKKFMAHQNNVQQIDEFLQGSFELHDLPDDNSGYSFQSLGEWASSIAEVGKNVEVWLYFLCFGFLLLGVWAVYLFIRDIQQELRWIRVIMMMIVLTFFICCLWHWRHMHKVAESRRHAQMMKRGYNNIPEECKPGGQGTSGSLWEWIKVRAFGAPDVCEKYFEELMIDPSEEITPAMVIAETLAKFFLQPLQHLGSESARFITNFYQIVPIVYHVHATIFFIVLLIIILFAFCGYGIDFPLWMGGIRPIYRTETADTSDVDRITKEAIAQLKIDREKFMSESRMMLTDIAQAAAASSQINAGIQPVMMMSSNIIASQLEHLIARQFSNVIAQNGTEPAVQNSLSNQKNVSRPSPGVYTVTSTPLRRQFALQRSDSSTSSNQDLSDGNGGNLNGNEAVAEPLSAVTDAVHYRLKGSPRKIKSASKNERNDSTSSVSSSVGNVNQGNRNKQSIENLSDGKDTQSTDMSVVRRRAIREPDDCSNLSASHSEPSSSQSLNETKHDVTDSGENFYNKVKNILEDSANSSINFENSDTSGREEEIELSASGTKFLGKITQVMTP